MDLVEKVSMTIGCTKADGERAVESIIAFITDSLAKGEEVSVAGLGIFEAKSKIAGSLASQNWPPPASASATKKRSIQTPSSHSGLIGTTTGTLSSVALAGTKSGVS